jgi:pyruvate dehydrogenase E2 component (dihydrolipoamide acetyltransferase)
MSRIKEFNLPDLGEGLTEGEILSWLVKVGDIIELNQPIVEVETAKAAVEIPAKWAGRISRIFVEAGTTVEVGSPIVAIDTDPSAGPLPDAHNGPVPSAESLAAVEIAPAEGAIEPGMIGGPAPGGRTAVLVGYGPKTASAKRRPRSGTPTATTTAAPETRPQPEARPPAAPPEPTALAPTTAPQEPSPAQPSSPAPSVD